MTVPSRRWNPSKFLSDILPLEVLGRLLNAQGPLGQQLLWDVYYRYQKEVSTKYKREDFVENDSHWVVAAPNAATDAGWTPILLLAVRAKALAVRSCVEGQDALLLPRSSIRQLQQPHEDPASQSLSAAIFYWPQRTPQDFFTTVNRELQEQDEPLQLIAVFEHQRACADADITSFLKRLMDIGGRGQDVYPVLRDLQRLSQERPAQVAMMVGKEWRLRKDTDEWRQLKQNRTGAMTMQAAEGAHPAPDQHTPGAQAAAPAPRLQPRAAPALSPPPPHTAVQAWSAASQQQSNQALQPQEQAELHSLLQQLQQAPQPGRPHQHLPVVETSCPAARPQLSSGRSPWTTPAVAAASLSVAPVTTGPVVAAAPTPTPAAARPTKDVAGYACSDPPAPWRQPNTLAGSPWDPPATPGSSPPLAAPIAPSPAAAAAPYATPFAAAFTAASVEVSSAHAAGVAGRHPAAMLGGGAVQSAPARVHVHMGAAASVPQQQQQQQQQQLDRPRKTRRLGSGSALRSSSGRVQQQQRQPPRHDRTLLSTTNISDKTLAVTIAAAQQQSVQQQMQAQMQQQQAHLLRLQLQLQQLQDQQQRQSHQVLQHQHQQHHPQRPVPDWLPCPSPSAATPLSAHSSALSPDADHWQPSCAALPAAPLAATGGGKPLSPLVSGAEGVAESDLLSPLSSLLGDDDGDSDETAGARALLSTSEPDSFLALTLEAFEDLPSDELDFELEAWSAWAGGAGPPLLRQP